MCVNVFKIDQVEKCYKARHKYATCGDRSEKDFKRFHARRQMMDA